MLTKTRGQALLADDERPSRDVVLDVRGLSVDFGDTVDVVHAVSDVSFTLRSGQILGIAGESGAGKSTLASAICRLLSPPGRVISGTVTHYSPSGAVFDVLALDRRALRQYRWERLSLVFQGAMNVLNPVQRIMDQLTDTLAAHRPKMPRTERRERAAEMLELVGLPRNRLSAYPHQLSGGQRQRVVIAIALVLEPEVVIMDEPTTALDVVVQREVLARIAELRQRLNFSIIFITHDMSLLIEMADSIAVLYAGRIVEFAPAGEIHQRPRHPYTAGLLGSFPEVTGPLRELQEIPGSPPDLRWVPAGCAFHPRCPHAMAQCNASRPELTDDRDHLVACWLGEGRGLAVSPASRSASPVASHQGPL